VSGCAVCPLGSYSDTDTATTCTLCPQGWSTPSTASTSRNDCRGQYLHQPLFLFLLLSHEAIINTVTVLIRKKMVVVGMH
jgi:hypothetical protein